MLTALVLLGLAPGIAPGHSTAATAPAAQDSVTAERVVSGEARIPIAPHSIFLYESRPVETTIGNPSLPRADAVWAQVIHDAKSSLDLEEFYFSDMPGEPLRLIVDEIGLASRRGVRVRLLLDAGMHRTYPLPADSLGRLPGIEVRTINFGRLAGGVQHSKYIVADAQVVLEGSQNMDWRSFKHIHELGACVRDSAVARVFQDLFDLDWNIAGDLANSPAPETRPTPGAPARDGELKLVAAAAKSYPVPYVELRAKGDTAWVWPGMNPRGWLPDSTLWDESLILKRIGEARSEIVMQSLDYATADRGTTDRALDQALRDAAARGVRVKMVLSDWNTSHPGIDDLKSLTQVPNVAVKMSTVPEWSGGYIPFARVEHCKYMVVDSAWTWVGTSNWEPGYFHTTRNVGLTIRNAGIARQARQVFEATWTSPIAAPIDPAKDYPPKVRGETPPPGVKKYGD